MRSCVRVARLTPDRIPPVSRSRGRRAFTPTLLIVGIMALAATLRLWTIGDGLPYSGLGQDEPDIMTRAVRMMQTGDYNPHFVDYGGLTIYLHLVVASIRFLFGAMRGEWTSLAQIWDGHFFLWSRVVTALISALTVYVVYRAGLRWNQRIALFAALAMAVHSGLVREAHFVLTDTPLTFFVAVTLLMSLCAGETKRFRWFLIAGASAGLAAAVKYNGVVALIMPLGAALAVPSLRAGASALAGTIGGAVLAFALGSPYALIDLPAFLNGFAALMQHYNQARPVGEQVATYLKHLGDGFTITPARLDPYRLTAWPAAALCLAGAATIARDLGRRGRRALPLTVLLFPIAYFWFIANQSLLYARYLMPLFPVLCLCLALGGDVVRRWLADRFATPWARRLGWALLAFVLLGPAIDSVSWNRHRARPDTREQAAQWMLANIAPTDPVAIETMEIRLPPQFRSTNPNRLVPKSAEKYREEGIVYLVSFRMHAALQSPATHQAEADAYRALLPEARIVEIFSPRNGEVDGPTITILKLR